MNQPHLVYFADPMCSWCWGFSPVISDIRARFGERLPIRLVMGGLRPGTTKAMDDAAKANTRGHWQHVHDASGQPFDYGFFERHGFVYDTEPSARAVVLARRRSMAAALDLLQALHRAFYTENQDITDIKILARVATGLEFDEAAFLSALADTELAAETRQDFLISQATGVTGFPTLIAGTAEGKRFDLVAQGFQSGEHILPALSAWLQRHGAGQANES